MALVSIGGVSEGKRFIATSSATRVTIADEADGQEVRLVTLSAAPTPASDESVVAMTVGCQGKLLAACTSEKRLVVWECGEWRVRGERTVAKRVTSLQISLDGEHLLTADKTGTVTRYCLSDLGGGEGEEMMGHLSMTLDMVMVSHDSHVITCDRDEKIRVSRYPNCYNIETYCLGHTEFVSCLCLCRRWPHLLISASGDGTVRSWEWRKGRLLDTHHCSGEGKEPVAVTQVVCSGSTDQPLTVASLEGAAELIVLQLSSDGRLKRLPVEVPLSVSPWNCAFDWSDRLWVCLPHEKDPVQCWQFKDNKYNRCSDPLQQLLSNWDLFRDCRECRDWSGMRKTTFDNMTDYLARKEERIRQRATARLPASAAKETAPQPPPEKKVKT